MITTIAITLVPVAFVMFLGYRAGRLGSIGCTDRALLSRFVLRYDLRTSTLKASLLAFPDMVFMGVPIPGELHGPSSPHPVLSPRDRFLDHNSRDQGPGLRCHPDRLHGDAISDHEVRE